VVSTKHVPDVLAEYLLGLTRRTSLCPRRSGRRAESGGRRRAAGVV